MSCLDFEERLSAYADGELPAGERASVEAHLASCGDCRLALDALRLQHRELEAAFAPMREGADALARRVIAAVHARPAPARARRPWLPMAASAAAGFLVAWVLFRAPDRAPDERPFAKGGDQSFQTIELSPPAARLVLSTGPVEVRAGNEGWATCTTNDALAVGAWVRTPPRSKCSFRWSDGSELFLNEATEIQVASPRTIQLSRGEVYALANEQPAPFRVENPVGVLEANGASLNMLCGNRKGEPYLGNFAVTNGRVRVLPVKGQRLVLEGQEMTTDNDGWFYATPLDGRLVLATRWVHELLALKGNDPELERRVLALLDEVGTSKGRDPFEEEIRALGERAAPSLARAVREGKVDARRRNASRLLADLAGPGLVPDLVALVQDSDDTVRQACARGLQRVTGQPFRDDAKAWTIWYKDNEAVWGAPAEVQKRAATK